MYISMYLHIVSWKKLVDLNDIKHVTQKVLFLALNFVFFTRIKWQVIFLWKNFVHLWIYVHVIFSFEIWTSKYIKYAFQKKETYAPNSQNITPAFNFFYIITFL
jgi:hypothetical protein